MARASSGKPAGRRATAGLPSREDVLAFVADNPDLATKRDIAKAFSLRGADRVALKDMLRELADEGLLEKRRKRLVRPGALPPVAVLEIFSRDADGGLLARPAEWDEAGGVPPPLVVIRSGRPGKGPQPGVGDRVLARIAPADEAQGPPFTARVMKRIEHRRTVVLGVLRELADGTLRIEPVERRQPELTVDPEFRGEARNGDLVEVEPVRAGRYGLPKGKVTNVIGLLGSEKAISTIALHAHGIPHEFPAAVIEEGETARPAAFAAREDWRRIPFVTIDPADAKDHDDAVFAEPDEDEANRGGVVVLVAIADVAAYVPTGSAMDREALKRGNSVYFPDRVVPMLPERISNDLCSLREGEDRPALAVRMVFDAEGRKIRHGFHRVTMRSVARLAYRQAQDAIDGRTDETTAGLMETVLEPLWKAYAVLKRGRDSRQPLELDLPERRIVLKPDGTVDRVVTPERLDAHRLIEEFMIQANVAAAETLERRKSPLIYRVHDAPSLAKQESLRDFLKTIDLSLARGPQMKPAQFNAILERVEGTPYQFLVNEVVLRSQSQAVYAPENIGHFGLNLHRYAHFTSPIRRYADLIVHRALISVHGLGEGGMKPETEERLEEIAAQISMCERRAMAAERETVDRLIARHLSGEIGRSFDARISGVARAGLFVILPQFGADGFIPMSSLEDDYYHHDESGHALVGDRSGKGYRLGDDVEVRLLEVVPLAGDMRFEMLSEPRPLPGGTKSFHKARGGRRRQVAKSSRRRR